jgi:1-aminocyclopropane-1-carboxylate deaminase/D-cysteine desulfhydrase-like pyridoxal-dependent ACC family enzyme
VTARERLAAALRRHPRVSLATLPTALELGPELPGGGRLSIKRDDLTGLGLGGNKARKLEFLCADALAAGADTLVTVGAAQSNHARMTAAAGAILGLQTHLVLGGEPDPAPAGNQLLSELFGAHMHHVGSDDWAELTRALDELVERLEAEGRRPYRMPLGGSTAVGALGFATAWLELLEQCERTGLRPSAIVHASSTGGTHAGLLAGAATWADCGEPAPAIVAIDVAKESDDLLGDTVRLANEALELIGLDAVEVPPELATLDDGWTGPAYAVPTPAGDAAIAWAARKAALVLDRTYTGKALAGLLGLLKDNRLSIRENVIFWHTGGHPAVFAPGGSATGLVPSLREESTT